jgi:hypothetical protein
MRCGVVGPSVNAEVVDPEIIGENQDNVRTFLRGLGREGHAERDQKEEVRSFHAVDWLGGFFACR